jgi:hypothetical protein
VIGQRNDSTTDLPIAVSGTVFVRVNGEGGDIYPGDLLVSSSRVGVAMRASNRDRAVGAVVGKALERYSNVSHAEGQIRMLVVLR